MSYFIICQDFSLIKYIIRYKQSTGFKQLKYIIKKIKILTFSSIQKNKIKLLPQILKNIQCITNFDVNFICKTIFLQKFPGCQCPLFINLYSCYPAGCRSIFCHKKSRKSICCTDLKYMFGF